METCRSAISFLLVAAALVLGAGLACSKDEPERAATVDIGTLTSVSGDLASLGLEFSDATSIAVSEINAAGGVLGVPIRLVVQDDGTSVEGARDGYSKLLGAGVSAVLGPTTSAQVLAIEDLIAGGGTVTIGRTTTADQLSELSDDGHFFRLAPSDANQATLLAGLMREDGIEHLCLVHRRDLYGTNLAARLERELARGPAVRVVTSDYDPATFDLSRVMARCEGLACPKGDAGTCNAPEPSKVGLVLLTFIEDGALIADDAERKGWSATRQRFYFSDGAYDRALLSRVRNVSNLEGARGTAPSGPDPDTPEGEQLRRFISVYRERFGRDPSIFVENAYDAMYMAAAAIEIAGTARPGPRLREAMGLLSVPGGAQVKVGDWAGIREAIRKDRFIDLVGASGGVDLDERGELLPPYYYVLWKVENGAIALDGPPRVVGP